MRTVRGPATARRRFQSRGASPVSEVSALLSSRADGASIRASPRHRFPLAISLKFGIWLFSTALLYLLETPSFQRRPLSSLIYTPSIHQHCTLQHSTTSCEPLEPVFGMSLTLTLLYNPTPYTNPTATPCPTALNPNGFNSKPHALAGAAGGSGRGRGGARWGGGRRYGKTTPRLQRTPLGGTLYNPLTSCPLIDIPYRSALRSRLRSGLDFEGTFCGGAQRAGSEDCNELSLQPATSYGYSLSPHLGLQSVSTQVTTPVTTPRFEERAQHSDKFLSRDRSRDRSPDLRGCNSADKVYGHNRLRSVSTPVSTPVTTPRFEERAQRSGVTTSGRNTFGNPAESVVPTLETRVVTGVETGVLTGRGCTSADTILYITYRSALWSRLRSRLWFRGRRRQW
eukprot:scaffold42610_cov66-Phaeocystis_antarctica.AAC.2